MAAQVVPFADFAIGCKVPDSYSFPTSSTLSRMSNNLTPQSSNNTFTSYAWTPFEEVAILNPASISTGGTITWSAVTYTQSAINTALGDACKQYRPVGGGLRIATNVSLTTSSGYLWVVHIPLMAFGAGFDPANFPTTEAQFAQYPLAERYTMVELNETPLVVPFRRVSDMATQWHSPGGAGGLSSSGGYSTDSGWCGIFIYENSGQTAAAITFNVERLLHLEYIPDASGSTFFGFGDAVAEPLNRAVLDNTVNVAQAVPVAYIEGKDHDGYAFFREVVARAQRLIGAVAATQTGRRALNAIGSAIGRRVNAGITSYIGAQEEFKSIMY